MKLKEKMGKGKQAPAEGTPEEEAMESPEVEAKEVKAGKGDKEDNFKKKALPFPKGKK
jgi:hypothetical protein